VLLDASACQYATSNCKVNCAIQASLLVVLFKNVETFNLLTQVEERHGVTLTVELVD